MLDKIISTVIGCILIMGVAPVSIAATPRLESSPVAVLCNNITLSACAKQIEEASNIRLLVPQSLGGRKVKLPAAIQPLGQFVQSIIAVLGLENVIVQYSDADRSVTLSFLGETNQEPAASPPNFGAAGAPSLPDAGDTAITPAGGDQPPVTLDTVVLPPTNPGDAPVTVRYLLEMEKRQQLETASPNTVILPPDEQGRSVTIGEFRTSLGPTEDPGNAVVVPPAHTDGKPVTASELSAARGNAPGAPHPDTEILPPDQAGGPGMTYRQLQEGQNKPTKP